MQTLTNKQARICAAIIKATSPVDLQKLSAKQIIQSYIAAQLKATPELTPQQAQSNLLSYSRKQLAKACKQLNITPKQALANAPTSSALAAFIRLAALYKHALQHT